MLVKAMGLFGRKIRFIKCEVKDLVFTEMCLLNSNRDNLRSEKLFPLIN